MLAFAGLITLQNCGSSKKAASVPVVTTVSYEKDIAPIMQNSCAPCHFPPGGNKKALNTYDDVKGQVDDVIARVKLPQDDMKFMPFKNKKPALTDSMITVLEQWKSQNMPQ